MLARRTSPRRPSVLAGLVVLAMLAAPAAPAIAQGSSEATLTFPARRTFEHAHTIATTHSGTLTITYVDPIFVRPQLSFSAAYAYEGRTPVTPALVQISFATGRRGGINFQRNRSLTLLLDQMTELPIGMMEYDVENNMVRRFIPIETFLRIVNASSVSGQMGETAFELDAQAMEAVRDLASRMAPR